MGAGARRTESIRRSAARARQRRRWVFFSSLLGRDAHPGVIAPSTRVWISLPFLSHPRGSWKRVAAGPDQPAVVGGTADPPKTENLGPVYGRLLPAARGRVKPEVRGGQP